MENGLEFMYQGLSVLLFCIAVSLLLTVFYQLQWMENEVESGLYHQHVLYSRQI